MTTTSGYLRSAWFGTGHPYFQLRIIIKISSSTQHPSGFQLPMRWRTNGGSLFYLLIHAIMFQFLCEKKVHLNKMHMHCLLRITLGPSDI